MNTNYIIIYGASTDDLCAKVNAFFQQGYVLAGGPFLGKMSGVCQAMYKPAP